jgi:hypothetical protein
MKADGALFCAVALQRPVVTQHTGPMQLLLRIIGWRCWCRIRTWVFRDDEGYYTRCLQCGKRVPYFGPVV